jgi:hypothetical protein
MASKEEKQRAAEQLVAEARPLFTAIALEPNVIE